MDVKKEPLFALATMLDPRYKGRLFSAELRVVKRSAVDEARLPADTPSTSVCPPPAKRAKVGPMDVLDDILGALATAVPTTASATVDAELAAYLREDVILRTESPTAWWAANAARFLVLSVEAKRFLRAPPTSVASERLFSSAAQIYTDRRSRLLPKRADMLLFVKHNLPLVKFNYGSVSNK